jgi:hypothetical protein
MMTTTFSALLIRWARTLRAGLVAAAFLGLSACGADAPTSPGSGGKVTGTWVLEDIDDEELPMAVHRGPFLDPNTGIFFNNYVLRVSSGYLEIRENETFYLVFQLRVEADGQTAEGSMELEGEWDLVDDEVVLRVQFPFAGMQTLDREDGILHTDIDFLGLGEVAHLHFRR